MKTLDEICIWKKVATKDLEKKEYPTFSKDSKCYQCTGQNTQCKAYTTTKKIEEYYAK